MPYAVRLKMATLGWSSEDKITDMGWGDQAYGYSIWFRRYDWHGQKSGNPAVFHWHVGKANQERILTCVNKAADLALLAWDKYKLKPPYIDVNGQLVGGE